MGYVRFLKKDGSYREFKKALKDAKQAVEILCEISEEMEDEYSYDERMSSRDEQEDMEERRMSRRRR